MGALSIVGATSAVLAIANTVRKQGVDTLGVLVLARILISVALLFVTRDPRILFLKPVDYMMFTGIYFLSTIFIGRPFLFEASKPIATKGDPIRLMACERSWERSARRRSVGGRRGFHSAFDPLASQGYSDDPTEARLLKYREISIVSN